MLTFGVLGPIEATAGERRVPLGGRGQAALLAVLLMDANRAVANDRLIEALWPDPPAAGATKRLQVAVARLRRTLAAEPRAAPRVRTTADGYVLELAPEELDAAVFEARVEAGRRALASGEPARAAALMDDALGLWRGPAYADVAYEDFAAAEVARLGELRLVAIEARADARLALGHHRDLVPELEALAREHPDRERVSAQLMTALYRAGRQAEALAVFRRVRAHLVDALGIEPGPELVALHTAILDQAPALIGREHDVRAVHELLAGARLVTILGPGGVGKTSVAVAVAGAADEPVAWVDLAALRDAADIASAILEAVGAPAAGGDAEGALASALGDDDWLVVLDNLERLAAAAAPLLAGLLDRAPGLRLLATSRVALGLRAEHRHPLAPLSVAPEAAGREAIAASPAEALFAQRARRRDPGFRLDADNAAAVSAICRRLGGLPLAVELAAARVSALAPAEILERLSLDLAAPDADAPPRQHSLRATLDWSAQLLSAGERDAFERLSVFAGGARPEDAEAVAGCDLGVLEALVAHSLLVRRPGALTRSRLAMLEPVREYAAGRLAQRPDGDAVHRAHAERFGALCRAAREGVAGPDWLAWHGRLDAEADNVRAAARWATAAGEAELAAALAAPLALHLYDEHALLYDIAFDWDVGDEVDWLLERLGEGCASVLEPGCGTGRIVAALARRGLEVVGIDRSPAMLGLAERRLRAVGLRAQLVVAEMEDFDLGRRFDGAVCPINTLGHLGPEALGRHLEAMARHLRPGARYLVQLDLRRDAEDALADEVAWEAARGDTRLRIRVAVEDVDLAARRERQRVRIEVRAGDRAGEVVDEIHTMTVWTPDAWAAAVADAGFEIAATYDGARPDLPRVARGRSCQSSVPERPRATRGRSGRAPS